MSFTGVGVVAGAALTEAVRRAGADHVEPTIADNLTVRTGDDGRWALHDAYGGARCSSFAILVPGDLALLTAGPTTVRAYFDAVLPIVHSVAEPGAKIVFGSGTARTAPPGMSDADARARFARVVRVARDTAREHDLRIVLEPLNRSETNLIHTIDEAVRFLDEFDLDGVGVVADLFHVQTESESFDVVRAHGDRIGHVHLCDRDREAPGTRDWPWPEFLRAVQDGGYRGSVSLECHWPDDAESAMRSALDEVRAVLATA